MFSSPAESASSKSATKDFVSLFGWPAYPRASLVAVGRGIAPLNATKLRPVGRAQLNRGKVLRRFTSGFEGSQKGGHRPYDAADARQSNILLPISVSIRNS
jgi:hypothetical protein